MWFKNARLYAITELLDNDHGQIEQALAAFKFVPCTSQEALKLGFCFAMHPGKKEYCHQVGDLMVFSIRKQEKLLPSSVVNEELAPKIDAMEQEKGRPLSRKVTNDRLVESRNCVSWVGWPIEVKDVQQ